MFAGLLEMKLECWQEDEDLKQLVSLYIQVVESQHAGTDNGTPTTACPNPITLVAQIVQCTRHAGQTFNMQQKSNADGTREREWVEVDILQQVLNACCTRLAHYDICLAVEPARQLDAGPPCCSDAGKLTNDDLWMIHMLQWCIKCPFKNNWFKFPVFTRFLTVLLDDLEAKAPRDPDGALIVEWNQPGSNKSDWCDSFSCVAMDTIQPLLSRHKETLGAGGSTKASKTVA